MANILPEAERLRRYTPDYFLSTKWVENCSWHEQTLRTDQLSAIGYSLGYWTYRQVCDRLAALDVDYTRPRHLPGSKYDALLAALDEGRSRSPRLVADIGCGRGEMLLSYHLLGVECVGIDPSPGAEVLVPQTMAWSGVEDYRLLNSGFADGLATLEKEPVDTIVFCESIEHVRETEFTTGWRLVRNILTRSAGLFIAVNWMDYWPIPVDNTGYDHIRRIDDALYDRLSADARSVIFREGSHLVLQF